jgi:hypothetical protein
MNRCRSNELDQGRGVRHAGVTVHVKWLTRRSRRHQDYEVAPLIPAARRRSMKSTALCGRRLRSAASADAKNAASAGEQSARMSRGSGTAAWIINLMVSATVAAEKGFRPVKASYRGTWNRSRDRGTGFQLGCAEQVDANPSLPAFRRFLSRARGRDPSPSLLISRV